MKSIINTIIFSYFLCIFLLSCNDNKNYGNDEYIAANTKLEGTKWSSTNWDYLIGDDWANFTDEYYNIYFHSNTEGVLYYCRKDWDSDNGSSRDEQVAHFKYKLSGNTITLNYITDPIFSLTKLTLKRDVIDANGFEYTKGTISTSDRNWIATFMGTTGTCKWYHDIDSKIYIIGEGSMQDYSSYSQTPWASLTKYYPTNYVTISKGVTHVGAHSFENLFVSEVELPSSLESIGEYAFYNTTLSTIDFPDNVTRIEKEAFGQCKYLNNIQLPRNIEVVEEAAFANCKSANLSNTPELKYIGDWAFSGCKITAWTNSEVLQEIGMTAFPNCSFSTLRLPDSLEKISNMAFGGSSINNIYIGSGLTTIIGIPFAPASRGRMYVNKNTPIKLSYSIIHTSSTTGEHAKNWTLYVPKGSKSAYSKATYWKDFGYIYEDSSLSGDGTNAGNDDSNDSDNESADYTASGSIQGHDYVDLGLPSGLLWATCNIGASSPEGYGNYYSWGETKTKSTYNYKNYKYYNYDKGYYTKYCTNSEYGIVDNKTTLEATDDAAYVN